VRREEKKKREGPPRREEIQEWVKSSSSKERRGSELVPHRGWDGTNRQTARRKGKTHCRKG